MVARALDEAALRPETLDYFFDNLNSPVWIPALRERRLFEEPPLQYVDEQALVHAPPWSASRYLARVAGESPDLVLEVISSIRTNNEHVVEDFVSAALSMPATQAAKAAVLFTAFIGEQEHLYYLLPRRLVDLLIFLSRNNELGAALRLARELFQPEPPTDTDIRWRPRSRSRFSDWEYDLHLRRVVDEALPNAPSLFLVVLVDSLEAALRFIRADPDQPDSDAARIWRVRIGDDGGRATDLEESLTSAVRDAAKRVRENELMGDAELVELLTRYQGELYERIAMYALSHGPPPEGAVARRFVLDTDQLVQPEPSPEYRDLAQLTAPQLQPNEISGLLAAIEGGPDVERYRELSLKYDASSPTEEDVERYVGRWQSGRLELLEAALPEEWRQRYQELVSAYGPPDLPLSFEVRTFSGFESPATAAELASKTDEELVTFLREWAPSATSWGRDPSVEGLAREFAALTEADPERISRLAPRLAGVRLPYITWMIRSFESAVGANRSFAWEPLINLLQSVLRERSAEPATEESDTYASTGVAAMALLERAFGSADSTRLPFDLRDRVWTLIETVSSELNYPEHRESLVSASDPLTASLNNPEPRAVRASIAYSIWVYKELLGTDAPSSGGLFTNELPEVAELLDRVLGTGSPPQLAVLGEFFANLVALDPNWAMANALRVFPDEQGPTREAAWGSYVIYSSPYDNVFEVLRGVYLRSAELLGEDFFNWMNTTPAEKLAEHIGAFYWRSRLELDDPMLALFWARSPNSARARLVESLGRWAAEVPLDPGLLARLQDLWEFLKEHSEPDSNEALSEFVWWAMADDFPLSWRLDELQRLLDEGASSHAASLLGERLPAFAQQEPLRTLRVTRGLIEHERFFADAWAGDITQVLTIAYTSDSVEASRLAYETVNWLLRRGYRQFAVALDRQTPD